MAIVIWNIGLGLSVAFYLSVFIYGETAFNTDKRTKQNKKRVLISHIGYTFLSLTTLSLFSGE